MVGRGSRATDDMSSAADAHIPGARLDRTIRRAVAQDVSSAFGHGTSGTNGSARIVVSAHAMAIRKFRSSLKPFGHAGASPHHFSPLPLAPGYYRLQTRLAGFDLFDDLRVQLVLNGVSGGADSVFNRQWRAASVCDYTSTIDA
jgi:hypothetical protein